MQIDSPSASKFVQIATTANIPHMSSELPIAHRTRTELAFRENDSATSIA